MKETRSIVERVEIKLNSPTEWANGQFQVRRSILIRNGYQENKLDDVTYVYHREQRPSHTIS